MSKSFDVLQAFHRWKLARTTLSDVIQVYERACNELQGSINLAESYTSAYSSIEQVLEEVDSTLASLQSEEQRLYDTRAGLSTLRNRSCYISPISRLPTEILGSIFSLISRQCERPPRRLETSKIRRCDSHAEVSPVTLASVCSLWRRVALASPCLWSHVDVVVSHYWDIFRPERTALWVERSQQVPLHIHISEHEEDRGLHEYRMIRRADFCAFLAPFMHRAARTQIVTNSQCLLDLSITSWVNHCDPNLPKALAIQSPRDPHIPVMIQVQQKVDNVERMFKSCYKLTFKQCMLGSKSAFHTGLVELRFETLLSSELSLQLPELVEALGACPNLQTLIFSDANIEKPETVQGIQPVALNHLKTLVMKCPDRYNNHHVLLPFLRVGSDGLDMNVTISPYSEHADAYRSFFEQTVFSSLHITVVGHYPMPAAVLCPIPDVQILGIHFLDLAWDYFEDTVATHFGTGDVNPWPNLKTLYLFHSKLTWSFMEGLAQVRSIRKLHMAGIDITDVDGMKTGEEFERLRNLFPWVSDFRFT